MSQCPTCNQEIDTPAPLWDDLKRTLSFNGETATFTVCEGYMVAELVRHYPSAVHYNLIESAVAGFRAIEAENNIRVYACKIRKKLKPLGISLTCIKGSWDSELHSKGAYCFELNG